MSAEMGNGNGAPKPKKRSFLVTFGVTFPGNPQVLMGATYQRDQFPAASELKTLAVEFGRGIQGRDAQTGALVVGPQCQVGVLNVVELRAEE